METSELGIESSVLEKGADVEPLVSLESKVVSSGVDCLRLFEETKPPNMVMAIGEKGALRALSNSLEKDREVLRMVEEMAEVLKGFVGGGLEGAEYLKYDKKLLTRGYKEQEDFGVVLKVGDESDGLEISFTGGIRRMIEADGYQTVRNRRKGVDSAMITDEIASNSRVMRLLCNKDGDSYSAVIDLGVSDAGAVTLMSLMKNNDSLTKVPLQVRLGEEKGAKIDSGRKSRAKVKGAMNLVKEMIKRRDKKVN